MSEPRHVAVFLTGIVNDSVISLRGVLDVNWSKGTKEGALELLEAADQPPFVMPDGVCMPMPRCFVGAKAKGGIVNPFALLEPRFTSLRLMEIGSRTLSLAEYAALEGDTLKTSQIAHGSVPYAAIDRFEGFEETLTVAPPDRIISDGQFRMVRKDEVTRPVQFRQVYCALQPDRNSFERMRSRRWLLKATVGHRPSGDKVQIKTRSTIEYV